jgi:class 3 adenylate cyclase
VHIQADERRLWGVDARRLCDCHATPSHSWQLDSPQRAMSAKIRVHDAASTAEGSGKGGAAVYPSELLTDGSMSSIASVPLRRNSMLQVRRSSSISSTIMLGMEKANAMPSRAPPRAGTRGSVLNSTVNSTRVSPEAIQEEKRARESTVTRASAVNEFNLFLKIMDDVAIHTFTLYFVNINSSAVIEKMEQSFGKYYANSQHRLYLRCLLILIGFFVSTFAYDYVVLYSDTNLASSISSTANGGSDSNSSSVGNSNLSKFYLVLVIKLVVVMPILFLTYFRSRKRPYAENYRLTWLSVMLTAAYPIVYNKVTNDYGVSWVCLVIMYVYSCSPIRFFPCSVFCLLYLCVYVVVMLSYVPDGGVSRSSIANETLYACLFFLLILLPSQAREFAIRVSYMSELMVLLQQEQLKLEETRSKALLNSMLPESIVVQLQCGRELIADEYAQATVLFAEVCDFDAISSRLKPQQVVELLNILFYKFDKLVDVHNVHKVETIGAVYMVVGGCPDPIDNHAELVANLALDMVRCMPEVSAKIARRSWGSMVTNLNIRIGINTGGLMAGVVGIRNPRFKLFGDTVNVASRMETTNLPGQIQITEATHNIIYDKFFTSLRGKVFVKGRGDMNTYFLRGKDAFIVPPPPTTTAIKDAPTGGPSSPQRGPVAGSNTGPMRRTSRAPMGVQSIPEASMATHITANATKASDYGETPVRKPSVTAPTMAVTTVVAGAARRMSNARHLRRQNSGKGLPASRQATLVNILSIPAAPAHAKTASFMTSNGTVVPGSEPVNEGSINAKADPLTTQRRGTVTMLKGDSLRQLATRRSIFRENIFDIVEDADGTQEHEGPNGTGTINTTIMQLPKGLTRRDMLFRVHSNANSGFAPGEITDEAAAFEESYITSNRVRWMRFVRLSITFFLILKPFMTLYQTYRLTKSRAFTESWLIFLVNFVIMYPVTVAYLLYTFSPAFRDFEQLASVFVILTVGVVLCVESVAANSLGHAYMSVLALYQCYFANISFLLRVLNGFAILGMYIVANLEIAPMVHSSSSSSTPEPFRVGRNALYIFLFFAGQAWIVFHSEFKQRINHFRDITLNSQKQKLVEEEARITKLLLNLLPATIVHKLKEDPEATIADFFDNCTVLFTDMVNFTAYSSKVSAMELVQFLNDMYTRFDTIAEKEDLYKVEIIGDAYFVVGGCPIVTSNNALAVVTAATDMFAALPLLRRNCGVPDLNIRIGIHSGPVLAGVVGSKDPRYHLFGETVTIAHFLESSGVPGRIHISENTWASMNKETPGHGFRVEYHTLLSINGVPKKYRTYFIM